MNYRNEIVITGNLGSEPKFIETKKAGIAIAVFSLANDVTRFNKLTNQHEKSRTNWIPIKLFGEQANIAVNSLKKGDLVTVFGKFSSQDYEGKDGKKTKSFEVIAGGVQKEQLPSTQSEKAKEREENKNQESEIQQTALLEQAFSKVYPDSKEAEGILRNYAGEFGPLKDVTQSVGRSYALRKWGIERGLI